MAVSPPSLMLKIIWLIHFVLTSWALLSGYLAVSTYWFTHAGVLACGLWSIIAPESLDAVIMFIATMLISVLNDIILLALYEPRGHDYYESGKDDRYNSPLAGGENGSTGTDGEQDGSVLQTLCSMGGPCLEQYGSSRVSTSQKNEYRFALGMTIVNLVITPVSLFLLYRVYQSRSDGSAFNTGFPAFGGGTSHGGAYDNIESGKSADEPPAGYYQEPPPAPR